MPAFTSKLIRIIPLLLFLWSFCSGQNRAQAYSQQEMEQLANLNANSAGVRSIDLGYEGVRGTPFLEPEWLRGSILFKTKDVYSSPMFLNINLEKNTLHFQLSDGTPGTFDPRKVRAVKITKSEGDSLVYEVYNGTEVLGNNDRNPRFYQLLCDGPQKFLKFERKYMRKADYKGAYNSGVHYDEYLSAYNYLIQDDRGVFHKIKLKKKSILSALEGQSALIQQLLKKHKFNLSKEEDVTGLLQELSNKNR